MKQILITTLFLIVLIIISGCEYLPSVEEEIIKNNASEFVIEPKIISPERLESLRRG